MPLNAANKEVINVSAGVSRRFHFANGRKVPSSGVVINNSAASITVQFQNAAPKNAVQSFTSTRTGGTFTITIPGWGTTAAITVSATAATQAANIKAAIEAASWAQNLNHEGTLTQGLVGITAADATPDTFAVEFFGAWANRPVPLMTIDDALATGGAAMSAVSHTVEGTSEPVDADFADVDPDGLNAAMTIQPQAQLPFSFGSAGGLDLLGPWFRIVTTGSGEGIIELSTSDDTTQLIKN